MVIFNLRAGNLAPEQTDYVHVSVLADGGAEWVGCVGPDGNRVDGKNRKRFETRGEAISDAVNWARGRNSEELYIETDGDA